MDNKSYTIKDIIMGLRDDFRIRNNILLEMRKSLYPLEPNIDINLYYDDFNKRVELEAFYTEDKLKYVLKYLFSRKYIYEADLYNNKDNHLVFDESDMDNSQKIFPIEAIDVIAYNKLADYYNLLLKHTYPIADNSLDIDTFYNSLVFIDKKFKDLYNVLSVDYNPRGDLITIANYDYCKCDTKAILNERYDKEAFSNVAKEKIDYYLQNSKPITVIDDLDLESEEKQFGIRETKEKVILVRKLVK